MLQFLIGFLCGCIATALVVCLLYANKKRQLEEDYGNGKEVKQEKKTSGEDGKVTASGPRILLVDDSKLSRTVIKEFLTKREVEIFEAESGPESLKLAQKYEFDLIFIDQTMPGMNGDETLRHLWSQCGVKREVPVVAVGSTIRKVDEKEFREKGYVACLGKPVQENRLEEILSQVLSCEKQSKMPEGFSYQSGLANFDGDETVYRETLVLFAELWKERKESLRQFLEKENMAEYAILIHAIKGDARTLGASALGELAYEQEMKAKGGKIEAVRSGFAHVIAVGDETAEYFFKMFS